MVDLVFMSDKLADYPVSRMECPLGAVDSGLRLVCVGFELLRAVEAYRCVQYLSHGQSRHPTRS